MATIQITISEELLSLVKKQNINISEVLARSLWTEALWGRTMEGIANKSKLTEKDAEEIGEKIKHAIARRHGL